jgi:hypothetical protein
LLKLGKSGKGLSIEGKVEIDMASLPFLLSRDKFSALGNHILAQSGKLPPLEQPDQN